MRLGLGVAVLGVLVVRIGAGPFLDGIRLTSLWSLLVAAAVTAVATLCSAWRWQLVAAGLGIPMGLRTAFLAVYRAQFLNATLPGGILGDVDRAIGHGRDNGAVGRTVRSVFWERTLGQAVQVALTLAILLTLASPMRTIGLVVAAIVGAAVPVALVAAHTSTLRAARAVRAARGDLRAMLGTPRVRASIAFASTVAVAGHLAVFLLAAHVAGVDASTARILPLAAVVLMAAAVPANVAGWGPREGVAAWAFGVAGLGTPTGVTTAVVYGVMALVATLPGALVLLAGRRSWDRPVVRATARPLEEVAVHG